MRVFCASKPSMAAVMISGVSFGGMSAFGPSRLTHLRVPAQGSAKDLPSSAGRCLAPPAEPLIAQIVYVSPDRSEEDGPWFEMPAVPAPAWQRKQALTIA